MIFGQPVEEFAAVGKLLRRQRRRLACKRGCDCARLLLHRFPVGHHGAHVVQRPQDAGGDRVEPRRIDRPIDLDMDEGLELSRGTVHGGEPSQRAVGGTEHSDDRMDDEVQRQAVAIELHRRRIDEERHVVVDDLDDRVPGLPAVLAEGRVEHAHMRAPRLAPAREIPV